MRTASGLQRLVVVTGTWCAAAATLAFFAPWPSAVLAGWDVAAVTLIVWVWSAVGRFTSEQTRAMATREDNSRVAASLFLLTASIATLVGAGLALVKAFQASPRERTAITAISAATVFLSWGVVQTVFALRYAHEYYVAPEGGIDFGEPGVDPDYQDFAYFALTIGMTFQVSDTNVRSRKIRRTVTRHALLAYLFGAVILAVMVNVIAGLAA